MTEAVTTESTGVETSTTTTESSAPLTATSALTETTQTTTTQETPAALPDGAVRIPGKDASAEDWSAFYAALGRPETPEAYELPLPDGDDGAFAKQVAPMLHKHGISAEQAKGLAADWNAMQAEQLSAATAAEQARLTAMDTQNRAEAEALKTEWGQAHDANMHHAKQAVAQFLPKEQAGNIIAAIEAQVGYKATIQMLHAIGKGLAEHDAAGMGQSSQGEPKALANRLYPGLA